MPIGFEGGDDGPDPLDQPSAAGGALASGTGGASGGFFPAQSEDPLGLIGRLRRRGALGGLASYSNLPDIEAPKSGRNRPRPGPGGGSGGVGPGGWTAFGGMSPNPFNGEGIGFNSLPIMRRKRGLSPMPGVMPGSPGKSDTVPAMLTPGEVVMNRGVTQNPELMQFLLQLNQQGAAQQGGGLQSPIGMSDGGVVPEMDDDAMSSGVHPNSPALQFIRLLLALDEGGVEGHKMGGVAGWLAGIGRNPGNLAKDYGKYMAFNALVAGAALGGTGALGGGAAASGGAGAAGAGGGAAGAGSSGMSPQQIMQLLQSREGDSQQQEEPVAQFSPESHGWDGYNKFMNAQGFADGGVVGSAPWASGGKGVLKWMKDRKLNATTRDANGYVTSFNPHDPWGAFAGNQGWTGNAQAQRLMGQAGRMGVYDPRGNQAIINSQIEGAQGTKDALVRRQMNAADLGGLDPAQQAVARLQALRETGRGVQDISAQIRGDAARSADEFYKNLFNTENQGNIAYSLGEQGARNDRMRDQNQGRIAGKSGGGVMGRIGGGILGRVIGGGGGRP